MNPFVTKTLHTVNCDYPRLVQHLRRFPYEERKHCFIEKPRSGVVVFDHTKDKMIFYMRFVDTGCIKDHHRSDFELEIERDYLFVKEVMDFAQETGMLLSIKWSYNVRVSNNDTFITLYNFIVSDEGCPAIPIYLFCR